RFLLFGGGENIAFGDAARFSGTLDGGRIDAGFGDDAANGGGKDFAGRGFLRLFSRGFFGRGWSGGGSGSGGGFVDFSYDVADGNFFAFGNFQRNSARGFGDAFGGDFVGFEFEENLIAFDDVAVFDAPCGKNSAGDGFSHGRDFNLYWHRD